MPPLLPERHADSLPSIAPRATWLRALVVVWAVLLPLFAGAEPAETPQTVTIDAWLVHATREPEGAVDPQLKEIARDLPSPPFSTFTQLAHEDWKATVGVDGTVSLGHGITVHATLVEASADKATVRVQLDRDGKTVTRTTVSRSWGRASVMSVGPQGAGTLVIPLRVRKP